MGKLVDAERTLSALIRAVGRDDDLVYAFAGAGSRALERMGPGSNPELLVCQEILRQVESEGPGVTS